VSAELRSSELELEEYKGAFKTRALLYDIMLIWRWLGLARIKRFALYLTSISELLVMLCNVKPKCSP
jgi:hypothetical protein